VAHWPWRITESYGGATIIKDPKGSRAYVLKRIAGGGGDLDGVKAAIDRRRRPHRSGFAGWAGIPVEHHAGCLAIYGRAARLLKPAVGAPNIPG